MRQGQRKPGEAEAERPDSQKGAQEPTEAKTEAESAAEAAAKAKFERDDVAGRWGTLPGKVEEMLQQLSNDQFPERYKKLIEQYYRKSRKTASK